MQLTFINGWKLIYFVANSGTNAADTSNAKSKCHDVNGVAIETGHHFIPGPDICR